MDYFCDQETECFQSVWTEDSVSCGLLCSHTTVYHRKADDWDNFETQLSIKVVQYLLGSF